MLIARARVVCEHARQRGALILRYTLPHSRCVLHREPCPGVRREAAACLGVTVGVGDVRLYVVYRCAVHEVGSRNAQDCPQPLALFNAQQLHAAQPKRVRTEGGARRKYSEPRVPAEPRRAHRRRPVLAHVLGKLPYQPQMAEVLYPAQSLVIAVFCLENYKALKLAHYPGLPGYAELRRKIAPYPGDSFQCVSVHTSS